MNDSYIESQGIDAPCVVGLFVQKEQDKIIEWNNEFE